MYLSRLYRHVRDEILENVYHYIPPAAPVNKRSLVLRKAIQSQISVRLENSTDGVHEVISVTLYIRMSIWWERNLWSNLLGGAVYLPPVHEYMYSFVVGTSSLREAFRFIKNITKQCECHSRARKRLTPALPLSFEGKTGPCLSSVCYHVQSNIQIRSSDENRRGIKK